MNERMNINQGGSMTESLWNQPLLESSQPWMPDPVQAWAPMAGSGRGERNVEEMMVSLVSAYLAANLNFKCTPLKEFMDDFEGKILRKCLTLTQGHQRNAAAILGLKCTALFEKMRKHGINGRQMKLALRLGSEPPPETR